MTRAEERQLLLLAELQHRVRNTLGVIRNIARRSAETSSTVEGYAKSLMDAQCLRADPGARDPGSGGRRRSRLHRKGRTRGIPDRRCRIVPRLRCAGAPPATGGGDLRARDPRAYDQRREIWRLSDSGYVDVSWHIEGDGGAPCLLFDWQERDGPPVVAPGRRRGFGTELIQQTLAYDLKAEITLDFDPSGLRCLIRLPATIGSCSVEQRSNCNVVDFEAEL